jgi:predicted permease
MWDLFFSIGCLYILVAIGFAWKKFVSPDLNERHLSQLMMYFLAPGLVFWGFSAAPITASVFMTAFYYTLVCISALMVTLLLSALLGYGPRKRAILTMNNVLLNTGNLGIPIGLAFFGTASLPYTTATNMVAVILSYTVGVYFYSRGAFTVKESFFNIIKLPVLWMGALAIILNVNQVLFPTNFLDFLEIWGHMTIGFQLITLGVFFATYLTRVTDKKMFRSSLSTKFILLPILALGLINIFSLEGLTAQVLFLQSLMPAAVNNLNLASLYKCKPDKVTPIVFWTSAISLFFIPLALYVFI